MANHIIFGQMGEGKTTYLKKVVLRSPIPCIIIDTLHDKHDKFDSFAIRITNQESLMGRFDSFKMVYTPKDEIDFDALCYTLKYLRNYNLFIDELDYWVSSQKIPFNLQNLYRFSRHYDINIYATCRNPFEVHRQIRNYTQYFIIYKITEHGYLDYFEFYEKGISRRILDLPRHKFITITK